MSTLKLASRTLWALLVLACLMLPWPRAHARSSEGTTLRRFVLLVGSNTGGTSRPALRYAVSDAAAMAQVLSDLGGVRGSDKKSVLNPDPRALETALAEQSSIVAEAAGSAQRTEFVFYYSGHSDEQGLRLGDALVPYPVLRSWLDQVPADVRIVILDSCASGSFTRTKGGVQVAPFLFDASIDVRGQAVLTASAESEAAQESDRIGGSFFTHYLVSGLRGAADTSGDGRVTLSEAYRFAFDETLTRTGVTRAGAQHPSYDIRLSGSGDLVMTDLRSTGARLAIERDVEGRLFVRDGSSRLVAELRTRSDRPTELSLPSGSYTLLLEQGSKRSEARVRLRADETASVTRGMFTNLTVELSYVRGDGPEPVLVPVGLSLVPPYDNYGPAQGAAHTYLALNALYGEPLRLSGLALSLGGSGASEQADGALLSLLFNRTRRMRGVALSGLANASKERSIGLSVAGLFNLHRSELRGVALALGFNASDRAQALELAAFNFTRHELRGVAMGALQVAGSTVGAQMGAVNWSRRAYGLQAGGLNLARDVWGVQLGLVNVAQGDVHGAQFGMVNYARSVDAGIAPFSITREGGVHAQVTSSVLTLSQLAVRFDARYTYSFLTVSYHPLGDEEQKAYGFGAGFGGKIPIYRMLSTELESASQIVQPLSHWNSGVPHITGEMRLLLRLELHKYLSVLAGVSMNVLVNRDPDRRLYPGISEHFQRATAKDSDVEVRYGPGWVAGLRF